MAYEIKYRSEDEMKDSGIEWLGMIPKEWSGCKIKHIATLKIGNSISALDKENKYSKVIDNFYPYIATKDINVDIKTIEHGNNLFIPRNTNFEVAKRGTSLICIEGGSAGRKIGYLKEDSCFGNKLCNVEANKKVINRLLYYILQTDHFGVEFFNKTTGIIPGVSIEEFKTINTVLPNGEDQQKIANFLDIKTSEFDSIISKKEKLIKKLEEAKKSLISEVVTGKVKIVDGELVDRKPEEMKDSGVEWLGMIPKDWEVKRLKYLVNLKSKKTVPKNDEKYIGLENIESKTGKYLESNEEEFIAEGTSNIFNKNDVLFGKLRPYLSKCIVADFDGVCSSEILVFEPREIIPQLLKYYILNDDFIDLVNSSTYGAKMPRASWDFIGNTYMPYFSLLHQKTIIQYLDNASNKMDSIITKTKKQIKKLKEAKQSLISEAVTGKIDLRDWEIIETGGR